MVTNSYNRRRANKGTPPICLSKDPPPPPPPPYTCVCQINSTDDPSHPADKVIDVYVCTSLLGLGDPVPINFTANPCTDITQMAPCKNCVAPASYYCKGLRTTGGTPAAEIFAGYHLICTRWITIPPTP